MKRHTSCAQPRAVAAHVTVLAALLVGGSAAAQDSAEAVAASVPLAAVSASSSTSAQNGPVVLPVVLANGVPVVDARGATGEETGDASAALDALLTEASRARIVHLAGDPGTDDEAGEAFHRARRTLIDLLHARAGYDVLVLPVGLYEGVRVDAMLANGEPLETAAVTLYRVWRESEAFGDLLEAVREIKSSDPAFEIVGGLCRYHAYGKALYAPSLIELLAGVAGATPADAPEGAAHTAELRASIERLWGGSERLAAGSPELRRDAMALTDAVLSRFESDRARLEASYGSRRVALEARHVANMKLFVELEQVRAGDLEDDGTFARREKAENLAWLLEERFPGRQLIYWEGRGESTDALPTDEPVFVVALTSGG